jgi:hypothetical protein
MTTPRPGASRARRPARLPRPRGSVARLTPVATATYAAAVGDGGAGNDGRLELDELGAVLDRATDLDGPPAAPAADVLEGPTGPGWAERLEVAGITPFVRRHRLTLAGAAVAVLLAAGASAGYLGTRPPADDGLIAVDVAEAGPGGSDVPGVASSAGGVLTNAYRLTPLRPGDTVVALGLAGPGVGATSAHAQASGGPGLGTTDDVLAVPDCDDPRAMTATFVDYRLRVARTDSLGRTVTGLVALPVTTNGTWADTIGSICTQARLTDAVTTTGVTASADPAARLLRLELTIHSTMDEVVTLTPTGQTTGSTVTLASQALIPPRGTIVYPVSVQVSDCAQPHLDPVSVPLDGTADGYTSVDGLALGASVPDAVGMYGPRQAALVAVLPAAQARRVQGLLDAMCVGAPTAGLRVISVAPAPESVRAADELRTGISPALVLRTRLEIDTTATRVTVSDATPELVGGLNPSITSATGVVRGGRAMVTVDWITACGAVGNPPPARLVATSVGGGTFPFLAYLDGPPLVRALLASCPAVLTADQLAAQGWTAGTGGITTGYTP